MHMDVVHGLRTSFLPLPTASKLCRQSGIGNPWSVWRNTQHAVASSFEVHIHVEHGVDESTIVQLSLLRITMQERTVSVLLRTRERVSKGCLQVYTVLESMRYQCMHNTYTTQLVTVSFVCVIYRLQNSPQLDNGVIRGAQHINSRPWLVTRSIQCYYCKREGFIFSQTTQSTKVAELYVDHFMLTLKLTTYG